MKLLDLPTAARGALPLWRAYCATEFRTLSSVVARAHPIWNRSAIAPLPEEAWLNDLTRILDTRVQSQAEERAEEQKDSEPERTNGFGLILKPFTQFRKLAPEKQNQDNCSN